MKKKKKNVKYMLLEKDYVTWTQVWRIFCSIVIVGILGLMWTITLFPHSVDTSVELTYALGVTTGSLAVIATIVMLMVVIFGWSEE